MGLAEDSISLLFGDAGCASESSSNTRTFSVVGIVDGWPSSLALQSYVFLPAVERDVQKCLAQPPDVRKVAIRTTNSPASTTLVVSFVIYEIERRLLEKVEMERR